MSHEMWTFSLLAWFHNFLGCGWKLSHKAKHIVNQIVLNLVLYLSSALKISQFSNINKAPFHRCVLTPSKSKPLTIMSCRVELYEIKGFSHFLTATYLKINQWEEKYFLKENLFFSAKPDELCTFLLSIQHSLFSSSSIALSSIRHWFEDMARREKEKVERNL